MRVYLDHAATSPMPEAVRAAYVAALGVVGNPASTHGHGQRARQTLEESRESIARMLGCESVEVVFTSGGTESINLGLKGLFWARQQDADRPVLLVAQGEHHATLDSVAWLERTQHAEVCWVPLDAEGRVLPEALRAALELAGPARVALVSFLLGNNEVGTVQDAVMLTQIASEYGIPTHIDAVSALGQIPIDFARLGAAALSVSAHKVGGPVGVGALLLGRQHTVESLFHGGSQQRGRSGSQDVAGAVAFETALRLAEEQRADHPEHLAGLRDRLIAGVRAGVPDAVLRGPDPLTSPEERLPGNAHFTFPGCQGDSLLFLLDQHGISVSTGSACQAGVQEVSHVLLGMGVREETALGALRFTLSASTTEDEVDAVVKALPLAVQAARRAGVSALA